LYFIKQFWQIIIIKKKSLVVLGKSGLRVSELCLGAMTFGEDWGSFLKGASKEESKKYSIWL
jgi:aryl-alcohol dehydrogenase-like predicted oxidoreductase